MSSSGVPASPEDIKHDTARTAVRMLLADHGEAKMPGDIPTATAKLLYRALVPPDLQSEELINSRYAGVRTISNLIYAYTGRSLDVGDIRVKCFRKGADNQGLIKLPLMIRCLAGRRWPPCSPEDLDLVNSCIKDNDFRLLEKKLSPGYAAHPNKKVRVRGGASRGKSQEPAACVASSKLKAVSGPADDDTACAGYHEEILMDPLSFTQGALDAKIGELDEVSHHFGSFECTDAIFPECTNTHGTSGTYTH